MLIATESTNQPKEERERERPHSAHYWVATHTESRAEQTERIVCRENPRKK